MVIMLKEQLTVAPMRLNVVDRIGRNQLPCTLAVFTENVIASAYGAFDLTDKPGAVLLPRIVIETR